MRFVKNECFELLTVYKYFIQLYLFFILAKILTDRGVRFLYTYASKHEWSNKSVKFHLFFKASIFCVFRNEESPPEPISLTQSHSTNEETTGCHRHLTQQPLDPVLSSSASSSRHVVHDVCENLTSNDGPEPPLPLYSRTSNCAERNFIHENMRNARIPDEYYGSDVPLEPCQSSIFVILSCFSGWPLFWDREYQKINNKVEICHGDI